MELRTEKPLNRKISGHSRSCCMTKSLKPGENCWNDIMDKQYNCADASIGTKHAIYTLAFLMIRRIQFMKPGSILITFMTVSYLSITK